MSISDRNSHWVPRLRSILVGFSFFFFGSLSDAWLQRHTMGWGTAMIDDALVGLAGGLLVLLYEQRQRRSIIKKMEVIRQMNHHVRNALQVISLAASVPHSEQTKEQLQGAVERIEWALRDVLPGEAICSSFLDPKNLPAKANQECRMTKRTRLLRIGLAENLKSVM